MFGIGSRLMNSCRNGDAILWLPDWKIKLTTVLHILTLMKFIKIAHSRTLRTSLSNLPCFDAENIFALQINFNCLKPGTIILHNSSTVTQWSNSWSFQAKNFRPNPKKKIYSIDLSYTDCNVSLLIGGLIVFNQSEFLEQP